ncbi:hypothetical protein SLE2022_324230 [Rubroshorea leprosula]|uniref:RRM domain-containing protein n=1 Tax=Rubroshorea leprosula TaxID=152421 RepID=A0AAV5K9F7_9ROSI|nr:hypothetical protein SLEP1_g30205 [Rubroshorea leprosula]
MESDQGKLFVGGISRETSEDTLKGHFSKYGAVVSSVVARDKNTKSPRGFGFVLFSEPSSADKALQDTHVILGRTVEVKKAIPRSEQHQNQPQHHNPSQERMSQNCSNDDSRKQFRTKKIFVGGLSSSLTEDEFRSYFSRFGRITDVVVMHDSMTNRPRGFGFVTFDSEESVENVMQKTFHELSSRLVEVKRAVPKDGSNGSNNNYNLKGGVGRRPSYSGPQPFEYPPSGPGYEVFPGYTTFPGYNGIGAYPCTVGFYGGGYPAVGYGRIGYGMSPMAPRGPLYPPMILGGRVCPVLPYGGAGASGYAAYMNGGIGMMGTVPGGNWIMSPGVDEKLDQVLGGTEDHAANGSSPQIEGIKSDNPSGVKKYSGGASSKQSQRTPDGKLKPLPVGDSR